MIKQMICIASLLLMMPLSLLAHGGHGTGFVAGLTHPIFGLDHLVAILGVAIYGFSLMKERRAAPITAFLVAMTIGGCLGIQAQALEVTEWIIVLSVILVGVILAFEVEMPFWAAAGLFGVIGFFHGHAHGVEMPESSNILLYVLGFVVGVGLIGVLGYLLSKIVNESIYIRLLGAFIAGMGCMMILG